MPSGPDPYDALLLVSFGGPERPEDVVPFLRNVTTGKNIPDERLVEVGAHYELFGGRSPINDQNRALLAAIREDFASNGLDLPVYWGNRNWDPYLTDALEQMKADGIRRAACIVTSAYSSYSGCRQYRENLADAAAAIPGAPQLDRLRAYFNHPGFVEPNVDATLAALAQLPDDARHEAHLVFVTHSIPEVMNAGSGPIGDAYVYQHRVVMDEISDRVQDETGHRYPSALVYCSRSGPPSMPWLEPDVNDHLAALNKAGVPGAVLVPIGFVSDHMEVIYDLDTEAMATARDLGMACERAATAGVDPRFVAMVRELLLERAAVERGQEIERAVVGPAPAAWDVCAPGCCANPRGPRPALCGSD
ncbi:ferrochelatase [Nocardioides marmoriginsengisoli]|uniref:Coproporphyrin III ferrochelatase n=1 Tax=Nocardioides marmoriginsengisoli TaxID=661483 RepID=A0A3N0CNJ4_9ACTN|nr:ferrochelatase [Nocardioides marmoriginsengisoli]RNL64871.1 ferrochelatase [Nocardioides marmoriginsengisoli]